MMVVGRVYVALCLVTATGAASAALAGAAFVTVATPRDALAATVTSAIELLVANTAVAMWPLALVVLRWHAIPLVNGLADALIAANVAFNGLLVGGAIGQRPELWRYLPHLPVEWLALSFPAAAWILARRDDLAGRVLGRLTLATVAALVVAAALETWTVPL